MVNHTPAKFGGHRHLGSGDMLSVCHVISQDHVTKKYTNIIDRRH